ncbi:hypothetical protein GCS55_25535, partial [Vibrio parahaemolyticus]|nr:hypothetical protein [Vibrio parahaemolyticus]
FIHSWSKDFENELVSLYNPALHCIEEQRDFPQSSKIANNRDVIEIAYNVFSGLKRPTTIKSKIESNHKEAFRAFSRWYSNKRVLELKSEYEKTHNFKYDCVMVLRLDVGFYSKVDFSEYDMTYFYASNWNDYPTKDNNFKCNQKNNNLGKGFLDFWFFSNSDNMDEFSTLFDDIGKYHVCPHRSSYQHVTSFTDKIAYTMFRWNDFEMIRRKEFNSEL